MPKGGRSDIWLRFSKLRRQRRFQTGMTFALVFLGPLLAVGTFLVLGPFNLGASSQYLRLILLADLVYILVIAALILARVLKMISERRRKSEGSALHLRLTAVFAFVALTPAVLVAVFAVLTVNIGLEGWFSKRVSDVVTNSLAAAQAYESEHRSALTDDAVGLSAYLNKAKSQSPDLPEGQVRLILTDLQAAVQRGFREVYMIDGTGSLRLRGERSYLFDFERPLATDIARARNGEVVIVEDWANNEFRALIHLTAFADRYVYVSRMVDGSILSLLDETKETVALYQQLEAERGKVLFNFGLLYLGFALILVLAAVWFGLWFAERLSRPVGQLASAAERAGAGDLSVQVIEEDGDDEIATLGRVFNQMIRQLRGQREALETTHDLTDARRRLFDSVLSNVTAGVIGLDADGLIDFTNRAAERLLVLPEAVAEKPLSVIVPEFFAIFTRLKETKALVLQEELKLSRKGRLETLLVRISTRKSDDGDLEGFVIAFDDVTELVSAQRMAAWGDVARRIAHEIKNPLTPIQLSAERIKRKFRLQVADPEDLDQYTDVIVRQTNDLRRIVDEFSKFARMPEPERREVDIVALLRASVMLQENGQPNVKFRRSFPEGPVLIEIDDTMIGQALTNLIKNAGESIESYQEKNHPVAFVPEIRVTATLSDAFVTIHITDNGTGLPEDRSRLFEPYVTTREKGTGLGLPIVKKIIEEHGGTLSLIDGIQFDGNSHAGATAEIVLPRDVKRTIKTEAQLGRGK